MNLACRIIASTILAAAAAAAAALPSVAWAQKAALTESIDEPGRNPYSENLPVASNTTAQFSAVPAGKRLVVQKISCLAVALTYREFVVLAISTKTNGNFIQTGYLIPAAPSGNFAYYAINSDILAFQDSGPGPAIFLSPAADVSGNCTLSGYYVTLP